MGGRKVRVPKPRVRSIDGCGMELPHGQHFSREDTIRRVSRNVKRWCGGSMALRRTVSALMGAQRKLLRVMGHASPLE